MYFVCIKILRQNQTEKIPSRHARRFIQCFLREIRIKMDCLGLKGGEKRVRKNVAVLLLAVIVLTFIPIGLTSSQKENTEPAAVYHFPASLREIGDEAFSQTGVKAVILREGLAHVGEKVFAGSRFLTDIFIPASMGHLEDSSFPQDMGLTIHRLKESYVADWVRERQIPFAQSNTEYSTLISRNTLYNEERAFVDRHARLIVSDNQIKLHERDADEGKSMRPQERPELNPIDYRFP